MLGCFKHYTIYRRCVSFLARQEYLRQSSSTAGRRPENIVRTVPVPWCQSGGSDTYRRHPSRKDVYDAIKSEHTKAKKEYARSVKAFEP